MQWNEEKFIRKLCTSFTKPAENDVEFYLEERMPTMDISTLNHICMREKVDITLVAWVN